MAARVKIAPFLWLQLVALRIEWIPLIALTLCLAAAGLQWIALPLFERQTHTAEVSLAEISAGQIRVGDSSSLTERYQAFRNRLAENGDRGELLKIVFAEAADAGISLPQGDYNLAPDVEGSYGKLQISLPVKGTYKQIRAFTTGLLEKLPPLSLDEISFRRESIKSATVEARVRMTLYLKAPH